MMIEDLSNDEKKGQFLLINTEINGGTRGVMINRLLEFKFWTRLFSFHIALMPLRKVWI